MMNTVACKPPPPPPPQDLLPSSLYCCTPCLTFFPSGVLNTTACNSTFENCTCKQFDQSDYLFITWTSAAEFPGEHLYTGAEGDLIVEVVHDGGVAQCQGREWLMGEWPYEAHDGSKVKPWETQTVHVG